MAKALSSSDVMKSWKDNKGMILLWETSFNVFTSLSIKSRHVSGFLVKLEPKVIAFLARK